MDDGFEMTSTDCFVMLCGARGRWTRIVSHGAVVNARVCTRHLRSVAVATSNDEDHFMHRVMSGLDAGWPARREDGFHD